MIGLKLKDLYEVKARIGKGAMGTVYRGTDTRSGRDVAVKVVASELTVDPAMLERFKREGEALSKLKHPNIVGFMDAFQHDEDYVIIMEYVPGGSLFDLIKAGPLQIERARQIALDLCDALIRAHRLSIIHRDLKPENILIDEDGTPKLADFGVARLTEGTRMTRSGMQVGTPYYMSPEAWEGKTLDAQADIWSLGVVLFEMLSGQVPFGGDTPLAVMTKISTTPPPDLRKLRTEVPSILVRITGKMLTRDKRRRYQTMREVAVDLERSQNATTPVPRKAKVVDPEKIEREKARRAARGAALAKRLNSILSTIRSALARLVSGSKTTAAKVPRYFWIALGSTLVIALSIYLLLQSRLAAGLPPLVPAGPLDGSVVFSGTSAGANNFYLYDPANGTFSIIDAGDGNNWDPVLRPSGNILFTSDRDGHAEIYRRFTDGRIQRITDTPEPYESWGPVVGISGNIYFTSNQGDGKAEIYRLKYGETQAERVTDTPESYESWGPVLGSSGNIYFTSNQGDGKAEIYRLKYGQTQAERVTDTPESYESWGPVLGSSGNIYFTSNQGDGKAEIYRLRYGQTQAERVTDTPDPFESWGPVLRGQNIYFTSNRTTSRSNKYEVYLHKPGSQAENILQLESWTNLFDERVPGF